MNFWVLEQMLDVGVVDVTKTAMRLVKGNKGILRSG